jgi:hypothetical protein
LDETFLDPIKNNDNASYQILETTESNQTSYASSNLFSNDNYSVISTPLDIPDELFEFIDESYQYIQDTTACTTNINYQLAQNSNTIDDINRNLIETDRLKKLLNKDNNNREKNRKYQKTFRENVKRKIKTLEEELEKYKNENNNLKTSTSANLVTEIQSKNDTTKLQLKKSGSYSTDDRDKSINKDYLVWKANPKLITFKQINKNNWAKYLNNEIVMELELIECVNDEVYLVKVNDNNSYWKLNSKGAFYGKSKESCYKCLYYGNWELDKIGTFWKAVPK